MERVRAPSAATETSQWVRRLRLKSSFHHVRPSFLVTSLLWQYGCIYFDPWCLQTVFVCLNTGCSTSWAPGPRPAATHHFGSRDDDVKTELTSVTWEPEKSERRLDSAAATDTWATTPLFRHSFINNLGRSSTCCDEDDDEVSNWTEHMTTSTSCWVLRIIPVLSYRFVWRQRWCETGSSHLASPHRTSAHLTVTNPRWMGLIGSTCHGNMCLWSHESGEGLTLQPLSPACRKNPRRVTSFQPALRFHSFFPDT